jgi:GNAT superfamily N-acetyltransferase
MPMNSKQINQALLRLVEEAKVDPDLEGVVRDSDAAKRVPIRAMDGEIVGFMTPAKSGEHWRAGATYVSPPHRNQGVASSAIQEFFKDKKGLVYIEPENKASRRSFEKAGFSETGQKVFREGVFAIYENKYLEKSASLAAMLAIAGGAHVAQATGTNIAMHKKPLAKRLANYASAGFYNKNIRSGGAGIKITDEMKEAILGVISPETRILSREALHLGETARNKLLAKGMDPNSLSPRDLVGIRMITRGDFTKVHQKGLHKTPVGEAILDTIGVSPALIDKIPPAALRELEGAYKSKKNPLTSNLLANVTRPDATKILRSPTGATPMTDYAAHGANLAMAPIEPIAAGINSAKAGLAHPNAAKIPGVRRAKETAEKVLVKDQGTRGFQYGKDTGSTVPALQHAVTSNVVNPVSGHIRRTSSDFGRVMKKYDADLDKLGIPEDQRAFLQKAFTQHLKK